MSNHPRRVRLADYIERRKAAEGIAVELPDGTDVTIPPSELWPDEAFAALDANDMARAVELILGDGHARFVAAGGTWRILNGIVREQQGLDVGESEASSPS